MTNTNKIKELIRIAQEANVRVDRGNMIRWDADVAGKQYRYNIKKNVIRREIRSFNSSVWTRIDSCKISGVVLQSWEYLMKDLAEKQNIFSA